MRIVLCCVAMLAGLSAAAEFAVQRYGMAEGLPDPAVGDVAFGGDGFLWLAAGTSAVRFDSVEMQAFPLVEGEGRLVKPLDRIVTGENGTVWGISDGGGVFRREGGHFRRMTNVAEGRVRAATAGPGGELWLVRGNGRVEVVSDAGSQVVLAGEERGSYGAVLVREGRSMWLSRRGELRRWRDGTWENIELPRGAGGMVGAARDGGLWLFSRGRIARWLPGGRIEEVGPPIPWPPHTTRQIVEAEGGRLWCRTVTGEVWTGDAATDWQEIEGVTGATSLALDPFGNPWIGTARGLVCLRERRADLFGEDAGLPAGGVACVAEGARGSLWILGAASQPQRWRTGRARPYETGRNAPGFRTLALDRDGQVWVGSWGSPLFRFAANSTPDAVEVAVSRPMNVSAMLPDAGGRVWIAATQGLFRAEGDQLEEVTGPDGESFTDGRALALRAGGGLWVATLGGSVIAMNEGGFEVFGLADGVPPYRLRALWEDGEGRLWIGSAGGGLACLSDGKFAQVGSARGLPSDSISSILEDDQGRLWCGSAAGVFAVTLDELTAALADPARRVRAVLLDRSDGLQEMSAAREVQPTAVRREDGTLAFATTAGLLIVDPAEHPSAWPEVPAAIRGARADGVELTADDQAELAAGTRTVEIDYAGLNFAAPGRTVFRHRLARISPEWSRPTQLRSVSLSLPASGGHRFEVQASANGLDWSEPAVWRFDVAPFFWERTPVRIVAALVLVAAVGLGWRAALEWRYRKKLAVLERERRLEQERARISRDMHDDVGARLTEIALLAELAKPAGNDETLGRLSAAARRAVLALDEIVWAVSPRHDTLSSTLEYLAEWAGEFAAHAGLRLRFDLPDDVPAVTLGGHERHGLLLAVKEALNNVVKHSGASVATLAARYGSGRLEITVADDGRGIGTETAAPDADGIGNLRGRLEELGGRARIESDRSGTRVTFQLDLKADPT